MMFEIDLDTLRNNLQGPIPVLFSYFKKDGKCRNAIGTLHEKWIPEDMKPNDASTNTGGTFRYFDLEKNAWRSLHKDCQLVTMIE